jgi:hypothetical protein
MAILRWGYKSVIVVMIGETMNKREKIWMIVVLALLLAKPTVAQAAMYVEALLGGSTASNPAT